MRGKDTDTDGQGSDEANGEQHGSDDYIVRDGDFRTESRGFGRQSGDMIEYVRRIESLLQGASHSSLTADDLVALDELVQALRGLIEPGD